MTQQSPRTCSVCQRPIEAAKYTTVVEVVESKGRRPKETITASMHSDCATRALPQGSNFLKLLRKQAATRLAEDTADRESSSA